jgi:uncharacterized protein
MKEFIEYIVKNLVNDPDAVEVDIIDKDLQLIIKIKVATKDVGRVVGQQGRTIKALRTIAMIIGVRIGKKAFIEVLQ